MAIDTPIRFSNGPGSTVIVFEHPMKVVCPTCGSLLHLAITGIENIQMKTVKVPPAEQLLAPV